MALTKVHNRMIEDAFVKVEDYGAVGDGVTDDTTAIQAALDSGQNVSFTNDKIYYAGNLILSENGIIVAGNGATIKNISGQNEDVFKVTGNFCGIYDLGIDGNGSTTDGSGIAFSYTGLNLEGYGNIAEKCSVISVGKYETTGDMGGATQVGVGLGGFSSDQKYPNVFRDCTTRNNKNYGFSIRSNVRIEGGSTVDNGTNGVGCRYAFNITIRDLYIGTQKTDNPDTDTNGIYFDTEASGPDVNKNSRNLLLDNVYIDTQENKGITMTRWTDVTIQNCRVKSDVIIQSTIPSVSPDTGTVGEINILNVRFDGVCEFNGHQRLSLKGCSFFSTGSLGLEIDNVNDYLKIENCVSNASLSRIIRSGLTAVDDLTCTGRLDVTSGENYITIQNSNFILATKAQDVPTLSGTDKMTVSNCYFKNHSIAIRTSGSTDNKFIGNTFEDCGDTDNTLNNAALLIEGVASENTIVSNNMFLNTTNRSVYCVVFDNGCFNNNIVSGGTGTVRLAGTGYVATGNTITDTCNWQLTGTAVVKTNYAAGTVTDTGTYPPN